MQMGVLNACDTEDLGRELAQRGLKHVVCWRGKVADAVAERFSQEFYKTLNERPGEYRRAFEEGKLAATMLQDAKWNAGERRPSGSPCFLCHSSVDGQGGDILPDDEPVSFLSTTAEVEVDVEAEVEVEVVVEAVVSAVMISKSKCFLLWGLTCHMSWPMGHNTAYMSPAVVRSGHAHI